MSDRLKLKLHPTFHALFLVFAVGLVAGIVGGILTGRGAEKVAMAEADAAKKEAKKLNDALAERVKALEDKANDPADNSGAKALQQLEALKTSVAKLGAGIEEAKRLATQAKTIAEEAKTMAAQPRDGDGPKLPEGFEKLPGDLVALKDRLTRLETKVDGLKETLKNEIGETLKTDTGLLEKIGSALLDGQKLKNKLDALKDALLKDDIPAKITAAVKDLKDKELKSLEGRVMTLEADVKKLKEQ